jgi:hypothetical protein
MLHDTYMQVNQGDSWLLVVESQIGNLIPNISFGYTLIEKCHFLTKMFSTTRHLQLRCSWDFLIKK